MAAEEWWQALLNVSTICFFQAFFKSFVRKLYELVDRGSAIHRSTVSKTERLLFPEKKK